MTDIAQLGLAVDSRQVDRGTGSLRRFSAAAGVARNRVRSFISGFTGLGRIGTMLAGLSFVGIIAGITTIVNKQRELIDQNSKLAQALGGTVAGVQSLERTANRAGVSTNEMTGAATRLNQQLGIAQLRGGNAAKALNALGLRADVLSKMDIDERFAAISNKMQAMNLSTQQGSALLRDLGIRQASMAVLMLQGGKAIEESRKKLQAYGVLLSEIDATKVEMANDAIDELKIIADGAGKSLAVALAPMLKQVAEDMGAAAEEAGGMGNVIDKMVDKAVNVVAFLADAVDGLGRVFKVVANVIVSVFSRAISVAAGRASALLNVANKIPGIDLGGKISELNDIMRTHGEVAEYSREQITRLLEEPLAGDRIKRWVANARERADADAESAVRSRTAGDGVIENYDAQAKAAKELTDKVKERVDALIKEAAVLGMTRKESELYELSLMGATEQMTKLASAALDEIAAFERLQDVMSEVKAIEEGLRTEEETIRSSYERRRSMILEYVERTGIEKNELLKRLDEQYQKEMDELNATYWDKWLAAASEAIGNMEERTGRMVDDLVSKFGGMFEDIVFESQSAREALSGLFEAIGRTAVNTLGQMAAQWLAYKAVEAATRKSSAAGAAAAMGTQAAATSQQAALAAYASTAAIPITGPAMAPAAAAAALAATAPMAATVAAMSSAMAGMAHDGISSVPREGTWLLDKGERVVDSRTNEDLKQFLDNGGGGGGGPIKVVAIFSQKDFNEAAKDYQMSPEGERTLTVAFNRTGVAR